MSFPRYPKYRPSGVEWLGAVPEHWEVGRLGYLCKKIGSGKTPLGGSTTYADAGVIFIRSQNVYDDGLRFDDIVFISADVDEDMANSRVRAGDILLNITGASIGRTCLVPNGFAGANVNQHVCILRLSNADYRGYIALFLKSPLVKGQIDVIQTGAGREGLNYGQISKLAIFAPPLDEQRRIVAFLDRETAKIDGLIGEQRRLIELVKEKRQAVISHAVTRGLNPDAPLKPSGVEWLGDVPKHWEVTPLKYVVTLRSGGTPSKANLSYWDGEVPWASSKDLKSEELADTQDHITQAAINDEAAELVPTGSILTVVRGMILLHTFPVVTTLAPMAINQDLKAITPRQKVDAAFLAWLLRGASPEVLSRTDEAGHGTKVLRIESWLAMQIPVPPYNEQKLIVLEIREKLAMLDTLTTEARRTIDLLQERRSALISAAVTGQIDVRAV